MANQKKQSTEAAIRDIRRRTRRKFSPEEKIRIVLEEVGDAVWNIVYYNTVLGRIDLQTGKITGSENV